MTLYMHNKGMILSLKCVTAPYLRRAVVAANPIPDVAAIAAVLAHRRSGKEILNYQSAKAQRMKRCQDQR